MTDSDKTISPLRQRMIDDMVLRGFSANTQRGYISAVAGFSDFLVYRTRFLGHKFVSCGGPE